ncbi:hypothetical protein MASR2M78_17760 [Treponema sp.]
MKQITVMILYSLLILIHVEPQIQGCYPDLNWTGYFSKRIDRLYGPGYLESRLNKGASIQPTGMRNNATVYLFGPKYIFEFKI